MLLQCHLLEAGFTLKQQAVGSISDVYLHQRNHCQFVKMSVNEMIIAYCVYYNLHECNISFFLQLYLLPTFVPCIQVDSLSDAVSCYMHSFLHSDSQCVSLSDNSKSVAFDTCIIE
jgi:hypothetical protein